MQCADFEPRLQTLLDADEASPSEQPAQQLLGDSALAAHAAECADCRQLLAAMTAIVREEAAMQSAACPPGLTNRVLAQMQPQRININRTAAGRRMLPRRFSVPLAVAAALALTVPLLSWLTAGPNSSKPLANAVAPPANQLSSPEPIAAQRAAAHSAAAPTQPDELEPWSLVPSLADFSAGPGQDREAGLDGWGDDVREGLAPVARSTAGTLESLWQAISPPEDVRS